MARNLLIAFVCAGALAAPAAAHAATPVRGQTLMPGVVYSRQVEFTAHGPVVLHVLAAPRPTGLYALKSILSNDAVVGRERVTSMQRRVSAAATVAGVNAAAGSVIRAAVLDAAPADGRSSIGIDKDGTLRVDRVRLDGSWQGNGQRRILSINEAPRPNRTTLYTRAWGPRTPAESGGAYAVLQPVPTTTPNTLLTTTVTGYLQSGNQPIPSDGAVLVARRAQAGFLTAEAPIGAKVSILLALTPSWSNVPEAVGGGPVIVRDGKPVFRAFETFAPEQLAYRNARTGVGQTADGRIVFVVADGRQPGYSTGLTNFELALTMMRLGCITASALDAGPAATMAFDGKLLNRPSGRGEGAVAGSLALFYYGVYVPALRSRAFTASDSIALSYRLVRASTVTAQVVGPSGETLPIDAGTRAPGTYRFTWPAAGRPPGEWTFRVVADDDQARRSTAERDFALK
ncbi:MAG: phosphodiester glycosidase family protein [Gaiellaceae bacterium]